MTIGRIHVSIPYPDLGVTARRNIWENFVQPAKDRVEPNRLISPADLDRLALHEFNGRQVRKLRATQVIELTIWNRRSNTRWQTHFPLHGERTGSLQLKI